MEIRAQLKATTKAWSKMKLLQDKKKIQLLKQVILLKMMLLLLLLLNKKIKTPRKEVKRMLKKSKHLIN